MTAPTVAVVGAGITGLAAAWELVQHNGIRVIVLDSASVVGGKLRSAQVAGLPVDAGAESMLARRPEALALVAEAGLDDRVVHPRPLPASVYSRGRLWPLPPRTIMGVPTDPAAAAGVLSPDEVGRATEERVGPPVHEDVSVGDFVADRFGPAVVDRLVEPLLAGVYAGHARRLSLRACVPALWEAAAHGAPVVGSLSAGGAVLEPGPVFAGYAGGMGRLAADLGRRVAEHGAAVRTGTTVRAVTRTAAGWRLTVGPTIAEERVDADGVVLAVPAGPTARLLRPALPHAAAALEQVDYASVAIVTLALPRAAAPAGGRSGFLVPPVEPLSIKASTFSAAKWEWVDGLSPDVVLLRASLGRAGEVAVLQREDGELVETVLADLGRVLSRELPTPVDAHVQRWGGGLPQFAVGHLDRVRSVLDAAAGQPGLGLAGAAYEGVGIPACVASGRRAGREVAAFVRRQQ